HRLSPGCILTPIPPTCGKHRMRPVGRPQPSASNFPSVAATAAVALQPKSSAHRPASAGQWWRSNLIHNSKYRMYMTQVAKSHDKDDFLTTVLEEPCEIISFDIFDTVLTRNVGE